MEIVWVAILSSTVNNNPDAEELRSEALAVFLTEKEKGQQGGLNVKPEPGQ